MIVLFPFEGVFLLYLKLGKPLGNAPSARVGSVWWSSGWCWSSAVAPSSAEQVSAGVLAAA